MAPSKRVLVILTSHNKLGSTGKPTGWYLPEFAHPYYVLQKAGVELVTASPAGGESPLDPSSVESFKDDKECQQFLKEEDKLWKQTAKLDQFVGKSSEFDGLLVPGGHGPMFDLANDTTSQEIIKEFYEAGKVVSAVCHGPAAFANVKLSDGSNLVEGAEVTGFSNSEEDTMKLSEYMPFMLETRLGEQGGKFVKADEDWGVKVVSSGKDGRLITGQNPASAGPMGEALLKALKA